MPPELAVTPTGHAANELRQGNRGMPTASMIVGVPPTFTVHAMRTGYESTRD
jgi:hypothetical protein